MFVRQDNSFPNHKIIFLKIMQKLIYDLNSKGINELIINDNDNDNFQLLYIYRSGLDSLLTYFIDLSRYVPLN